jgi:hypothetical protein
MKKIVAVLGFVIACGASQAQIQNAAIDTAKCTGDVIADAMGMMNIPQTLIDCGLTIDDYIQIIMAKKAALADGGVGGSAEQARLQALLDAAQTYKASHPNGVGKVK